MPARLQSLAAAAALLIVSNAQSTSVEFRISAERPALDQTLISLHGETTAPAPAETRTVDQINRAFRPRAVAVPAGSSVRFFNNDNVRHHVYSFSPAKRFELPLYEGEPPSDIRFDEHGEVVLGCNIHDWMVGWVHVFATPHYGFADADGQISFEVPPGQYRYEVWHPEMKAADRRLQGELAVGETAVVHRLELELKVEETRDGLQRRGHDRF